jgi:GT2 family glycosyltransferase
MLSVAVIIVNYNGGSMLEECVQSVLQQTVQPKRIIVVDNCSQDGSMEAVEHLLDEDGLIYLSENTGFAKANNLAVKKVTDCEWIALLNPDAFPKEDWLENFAKALELYSNYDMYASCMVSATDPTIFDSAGDAYYVNGKSWNLQHGQKITNENNKTREVIFPCAGAGFYKRESFINAAFFDESYFCYHEDVDLGLRMQLLGYKCLYINNAVVHHMGSAITGVASDFSIYHVHRNLVWTYIKNMPLALLIYYLPSFIAVNIGSILLFIYKGRTGVILKSKLHAIAGIPRVLKNRWDIQRNKKITSCELLSVLSGNSLLKRKACK